MRAVVYADPSSHRFRLSGWAKILPTALVCSLSTKCITALMAGSHLSASQNTTSLHFEMIKKAHE